MLKMTEICQARDKPKMVQLFFPVLKKPFWLKTILRYFMLQWRSRKNFITSRLCSELIVISLHRACACSLQAYGPKSLSLQALKNTGVWTTLMVNNILFASTHSERLAKKWIRGRTEYKPTTVSTAVTTSYTRGFWLDFIWREDYTWMRRD